MNRETQYDRMIKLCADGRWVHNNEFFLITHYPHKRRAEIEAKGKYVFEERPCTHGIENSKDFLMVTMIPSRKRREAGKLPRDIQDKLF